jgi:2-polyprenyl-6-methoxyphenol hydroxylase-like FAD-dependent oxidoreductase
VIADGKGALPAPAPAATGDLGIKAHFLGVNGPRDAIELFGVQGHYGGLAAIEDGRWNAAFSVPAPRLREQGSDIDAVFRQIIRENDALAARLHRAKRAGPWLASALPRFAVRPNFPVRIIPIGNAAAALEPVGGEGMGLAMRSAELAAEALIRWADDADQTAIHQLPQRFKELWQIRSFACRWIARVFSAPALADAAIQLLASSRPAPNAILKWMGKR